MSHLPRLGVDVEHVILLQIQLEAGEKIIAEPISYPSKLLLGA